MKEMHSYVCSDLAKEFQRFDEKPDKYFKSFEGIRVSPSIYVSTYLSVYLPVCRHICLPNCPSLNLSTWIPANLSVCLLSVYLSARMHESVFCVGTYRPIAFF